MKLKAIVTINCGLYMDVRPEIVIDTENYEEAKKLILELHKHFYKLLEPNAATRLGVNNRVKNTFEAEVDIQAASELEGIDTN